MTKKKKNKRPEIDLNNKSKKWIMIEKYRLKSDEYPQYIRKVSVKTLAIPFDKIYNMPQLEPLNNFVLKRKQSYYMNTDNHIPYTNYFIEFYDPDDEFLMGVFKVKSMIDREEQYREELFKRDIYNIILTPSVISGIKELVRDNYTVDIQSGKRKKKNNNKYMLYELHHAHILLDISMAIKMLIPTIAHYIYMNKVKDVNAFMVECLNPLYDLMAGDINIKNKLYETINKLVLVTSHTDPGHWEREEIVGVNFDSKTHDTLDKVLCDIMFKYEFDKNIITFNTATIRNDLRWSMRANNFRKFKQLENIEDEDGLSDIDKLEMINAKFDEGRIVTSKINVKQTIKQLKVLTGLDKLPKKEWSEMVDYYEDNIMISATQKDLVSQFFAQYFKVMSDLNTVSRRDYMKLVIILKVMLTDMGFSILQHMLTSNMVQGPAKKLPKKKLIKILESEKYQTLSDKYAQVAFLIDKHDILFAPLTILVNSDYYLVDYNHKDLEGKKLNIPSNIEIIFDEYLKFCNLI